MGFTLVKLMNPLDLHISFPLHQLYSGLQTPILTKQTLYPAPCSCSTKLRSGNLASGQRLI